MANGISYLRLQDILLEQLFSVTDTSRFPITKRGERLKLSQRSN